MLNICFVVTDNRSIKNDLFRRLNMYFREFFALEYDHVLKYLNFIQPDVLFIEWTDNNKVQINQILKSLDSKINIYIITPDELAFSNQNFKYITSYSLRNLDLPALLGLTSLPIIAGSLVLWTASGNVLCSDGLEGLKPNEYPIIKLSSKERIKVLEFLMINAQGIENSKTATQIMETAWHLNDGPVSIKSIQVLINGIRHQIERNPQKPNIVKSSAGRPSKNSNTTSGYYIDTDQKLAAEIAENLNLITANSDFTSSNREKSSVKIFKKLSEWILRSL